MERIDELEILINSTRQQLEFYQQFYGPRNPKTNRLEEQLNILLELQEEHR